LAVRDQGLKLTFKIIIINYLTVVFKACCNLLQANVGIRYSMGLKHVPLANTVTNSLDLSYRTKCQNSDKIAVYGEQWGRLAPALGLVTDPNIRLPSSPKVSFANTNPHTPAWRPRHGHLAENRCNT